MLVFLCMSILKINDHINSDMNTVDEKEQYISFLDENTVKILNIGTCMSEQTM